MKRMVFAALLAVSPALAHDGHARFDAAGHVWNLIEMNGAPVSTIITLTFPEPGKLTGDAPCNRYFGVMWGDYPWFRADRIASTRRACPNLALETRYLQTLRTVTQADAGAHHLILTGDNGQSLVFRLTQQPD